jgi:hypothetical protein
MANPFEVAEALRESARCAAVEFLRTEIRTANTLLDVAATGAGGDAHARRRGAARTAYDEVARHLAEGSKLVMTDRERGELATSLADLARRLGSSS